MVSSVVSEEASDLNSVKKSIPLKTIVNFVADAATAILACRFSEAMRIPQATSALIPVT